MVWTAQKEKFALGIVEGKSQSDAYRGAYDCTGMKAKTVWAEASRLMRDPEVAAWIRERRAAAIQAVEIQQADVLALWWRIANADANELMQYRRGCCRYCHGDGFKYQWKNADEFAHAFAAAIDREAKILPDCAGGFDFDERLEPHPDCPECGGEGQAYAWFADTRHLTGSARLLFAGVKQTKFGVEILTRSQDDALKNVAAYLGMNKGNLNVGFGPGGMPKDWDGKVTIEWVSADAPSTSH